MKKIFLPLVLVSALLIVPSQVFAFSIYDYSVFSKKDLFIGGNVNIDDGYVGSDQNITIENDVDITKSVTAGGNIETSVNLREDEDVLANGTIKIGRGSDIKGNVDGGSTVEFGKEVDVDKDVTGGGNVSVGQDSRIKGNVDSGGNVALGGSADVDGSITASGTITLGSGATAGSQNPGGSPQAPQSYVSPGLPPVTVFGIGAADVTTADNQTVNLAPGSYKDMNLGDFNEINLTSGNYYFGSINMGRDTKIKLDLTGGSKKIAIYVLNNVDLEEDIFMYLNGGTGSDVYVEVHGTFRAQEDGRWYGTYYTPYDSMIFEKNSRICGALYSGDTITLQEDTKMDFCRGTPNDVIPEPATLSLLSLGLAGALFSRKKKL